MCLVDVHLQYLPKSMTSTCQAKEITLQHDVY